MACLSPRFAARSFKKPDWKSCWISNMPFADRNYVVHHNIREYLQGMGANAFLPFLVSKILMGEIFLDMHYLCYTASVKNNLPAAGSLWWQSFCHAIEQQGHHQLDNLHQLTH